MKNRTGWDFEFRCELNWLVDLFYLVRGRIVQEALKMEHENWWKRLQKHLLARLGRAELADLHRLGLRDLCERVLNSVYRLRLGEGCGS